jgi:hypothetical protein
MKYGIFIGVPTEAFTEGARAIQDIMDASKSDQVVLAALDTLKVMFSNIRAPQNSNISGCSVVDNVKDNEVSQ